MVTFEVEDIVRFKNELEKNGILVSEIRDMGDHGKTCYFHDPSHNVVQLHEK